MDRHEIIARVHGGPIHHVRSSLICTSVAELRAHGHFDDYVRHLPPAAAEVILSAVAASWMPIETGVAHYAACNALGLGRERMLELGAASGKRLQQSVFNTFAFLARKAGIDLWNVFPVYPRVWARHYDGGGLIITRHGPKEAVIDVMDLPFSRFGYFRSALCGMTQSILGMFTKSIRVRESCTGPSSLSLKVSWV